MKFILFLLFIVIIAETSINETGKTLLADKNQAETTAQEIESNDISTDDPNHEDIVEKLLEKIEEDKDDKSDPDDDKKDEKNEIDKHEDDKKDDEKQEDEKNDEDKSDEKQEDDEKRDEDDDEDEEEKSDKKETFVQDVDRHFDFWYDMFQNIWKTSDDAEL